MTTGHSSNPVSRETLRLMSSPPQQENLTFWHTPDFQSLFGILLDLSTQVCDVPGKWSSQHSANVRFNVDATSEKLVQWLKMYLLPFLFFYQFGHRRPTIILKVCYQIYLMTSLWIIFPRGFPRSLNYYAAAFPHMTSQLFPIIFFNKDKKQFGEIVKVDKMPNLDEITWKYGLLQWATQVGLLRQDGLVPSEPIPFHCPGVLHVHDVRRIVDWKSF